MDWKSHIVIGFIGTAVILYLLSISLDLLILLSLFSGLSALLPDIDHDSSKIRKITDKSVIIIAAGYSFLTCRTCGILELVKQTLIITGLYFLIMTFAKPKHRGITHSILFAGMYGAALFLFFNIHLAIAGFVGYVSHLIADREIKII